MNTIKDSKGVRLSLDKDDFDFEYFTAGGHGGQKQNKTSSACRCSHKPSGAVGISRDERSQGQNKKLAFGRCTGTKQFQLWAKMELAKAEEKLEGMPNLELQIDREMHPSNIKTEVLKGGKWEKES